jgi:hypothetical protein
MGVEWRKMLVMTAMFIICLHVTLALSLIFSPNAFLGANFKLARVYKYLVHLGPFFREESIQSSPHLIIEVNGEAKDVIQARAREYHLQPWKVNRLALRDYARRSADAFPKVKNKTNPAAYANLAKITANTFSTLQPGDSVRWTYYHKYYNAEENVFRCDTVFNTLFKWPG